MSTSNFISANKLHKTRILLLGGTSGIGFAVARAALEHGASVILSSSNPEKVTNAIARLKTLYPDEPYASRIAGTACDLGKDDEAIEAEIVALYEFATRPDLFGSGSGSGTSEGKVPINHIVFTAGAVPRTLAPTDPNVTASYLRSLNTIRFIGGALVAKHAPAYMPKPTTGLTTTPSAPSSSITYTSGALVVRPAPGMSLGLAGAGAIEVFSRALAVDLAPHGIRVNAVAPGPVLTEMLEDIAEKGQGGREGVLGAYARETVLGRVGAPEDTAEAYLALMRDGFATGVLLRSDGGFTLK
ncbi:oxidoreductase, short chain dehydrogenase/reductase family [Aspergillus mulundensis]|uniref:Uncharacterized protein n=1 Tax=Aspergillus mulundensis TaxID=1810919 RepID=A0A3D8S5S7_9EURO|nr:hypothetical protein DSM5745_05206 [Aspergillus mulundensis]RDW81649.1 hypothetical protein DSM5745_05206 [Aspergillus mulundensis]